MPMFCTTSQGYFVSNNAPSEGEYDSVAVTPSDSTDVPANSIGRMPRRLKVTGAGNVNININGGGTAVLTGLAAGQVVFVSFTRVLSTSTTATGIIALF